MHIRDVIPLDYPFFLREMTYGEHPEVAIEKEDFERIRRAKQVLIAAKSIEEKYDGLMENYIEFEKDVAAVCINEMVRGDDDYGDVYIIMRDLNIRISTLLSAAKMYVDHLKADIAAFSNEEWNAASHLKSMLKKHHEDKYFRLGDGIRNYAQHAGVPISDAKIGGEWKISDGKKDTSYHALKITTSKKDLSRQRELARKTLSEFDEEIDLKFVIGKYIYALGKLHVDVRKAINLRVEESRKCFVENIEKYTRLNECCGAPSVLTAIRVEDDAIAEEVQIHLNWDDVRLRLVRCNLGLRDFSVCYATTISPTVLEMEENQVTETDS